MSMVVAAVLGCKVKFLAQKWQGYKLTPSTLGNNSSFITNVHGRVQLVYHYNYISFRVQFFPGVDSCLIFLFALFSMYWPLVCKLSNRTMKLLTVQQMCPNLSGPSLLKSVGVGFCTCNQVPLPGGDSGEGNSIWWWREVPVPQLCNWSREQPAQFGAGWLRAPGGNISRKNKKNGAGGVFDIFVVLWGEFGKELHTCT